MKKSINKVCSIALILTTSAGLAGVGTTLLNNYENHIATYAQQTANDLTLLQINGGKTSATIGEDFTVPTAQLLVGGVPTTLNQTHYTVYSPIGEEVDVDAGVFTVSRLGEYRIVYSIDEAGKTYTATYTVQAKIGTTSILLKENTSRILPKKVWKSYTGSLYIPEAYVEFAEGEPELETNITVQITTPTNETLTYNATTGKLNFSTLVEGVYSVRYTATTLDGVYLNKKTVEFEVLADSEYSSDYTLMFDYSNTPPTSADVGETITLPDAIGKRGTEEVPVYYTIEAWTYKNGSLVNVTNETFKGKKVIEGNEFTANQKGDFLFYYNVTDALGKKAERTGFDIKAVDDKIAPEVKIVDPYNTTTVSDPEDVSHKLASNFENGENVIIKAIYAEDFADDFNDLTLARIIRNENQTSSSTARYTEEDDANKNNFNKDLVFNMTEEFRNNKFNADTMVDAGTLADGKYTVWYKATDSSGNISNPSYTFTVNSSFNFDTAPKVEFKDTFVRSIQTGETITFEAPVASDDYDDMLLTTVMYRYDNDDANVWTILTADENGRYSITVNKAGASQLFIRAKTENDAPMTAAELNADDDAENYSGYKYGYAFVDAITITDNQDSAMPTFDFLDDLQPSYNQNTEITIPGISISDDLVDYLNVNVKVTHKDQDGKETEFDVYDGTVIRLMNNYSLTDAKFFATLEGDYQIAYTARDAANNIIVVYQTLTVSGNVIVEDPRFANLPEALSNGTLELGESIILPVPTLKHSSGVTGDYRIQVKGPIDYEINKEKFTPHKAGTYTLIYQLFIDGIHESDADVEFKVNVKDTTKPEIRVEWNLNDTYQKDAKVLIPVFSAYDVSGIDMEQSKVTISSKSYSRTIKASDFAEQLRIYNGFIDEENRILAGETIDNRQFPTSGNLFITLSYNELYTVTYTAFDKSTNSNSHSVSYTIKVGDMVAPVITVADNIVADTVKLDSKITIDMSKISIADNISNMDISQISITVMNTTTNTPVENIHEEANNGKFEYQITTAGQYTITFTAKDDAGNTREVVRTFTVNAETTDGMTQTEIIGTILVVVAVLVLAGVVVYFIVSKKKIDKMYN